MPSRHASGRFAAFTYDERDMIAVALRDYAAAINHLGRQAMCDGDAKLEAGYRADFELATVLSVEADR